MKTELRAKLMMTKPRDQKAPMTAAVHAGCNAEFHLACSYPECGCYRTPSAVISPSDGSDQQKFGATNKSYAGADAIKLS